jgi:hypothetical protein
MQLGLSTGGKLEDIKEKRTKQYGRQNTTQKPKRLSNMTPPQSPPPGFSSEQVSSSCSTSDARCVTVKRHESHLLWLVYDV